MTLNIEYNNIGTLLWKYKVPILLGVVGSTLIVTHMITILTPLSLAFYEPTWLGVGVGISHIIFAVLYRWVIKISDRNEELIQKKRELINKMESEEDENL